MGSSSSTELDSLHSRVEALEGQLALGFAQIVSEVSDPICQFDRRLRYVYVNPAYERWSGIPKSGLLGKTLEEAGIAGAVAKAWRERVSRVIESGEEASYGAEYPAAG